MLPRREPHLLEDSSMLSILERPTPSSSARPMRRR